MRFNTFLPRFICVLLFFFLGGLTFACDRAYVSTRFLLRIRVLFFNADTFTYVLCTFACVCPKIQCFRLQHSYVCTRSGYVWIRFPQDPVFSFVTLIRFHTSGIRLDTFLQRFQKCNINTCCSPLRLYTFSQETNWRGVFRTRPYIYIYIYIYILTLTQ